MTDFYAHSTDDPSKQDWQSLSNHLHAVGERASDFAAWFDAADLARVAGLLHDLGKYTDRFQARLEGRAPKLDHATWGARVAVERYGLIGSLLAYAIAGHHAGLANGSGNDGRRTALPDRLAAALAPLRPEWKAEIALPAMAELRLSRMKVRSTRTGFQFAFLGRMLFSALVDADYLDTSAFYKRIEGKKDCDPTASPSIAALRGKLDKHMGSLQSTAAGGEVNRLRAEVLTAVRAHAVDPPGLFSLTVPTGGGKTLASMAFALDHAIAHGLRRVIYVIPFTSIIEQNAAVFRKAFGELGEAAVLEHHSAFVDDPGAAPEARDKLRRAMENWDAPVVVTTAVQFFESLFGDRPSRCRKLHNLAGSVIVLDEAQTLPLDVLKPCVAALDELALNYRASVVLCTATQPALRLEDGFTDGLIDVRELAPEPEGLYRRLRRVKVRHAGAMDDDSLATELRAREQVLCIVNTRKHARVLYEGIAESEGARHLTTLMNARHRSAVLADIRQRLQAGLPCRVVSTSLIEAGVDVDFPTVLRAEAGLDAIAQAAGRCNREGKRALADSELIIFEAIEHASPKELARFAQAFRNVAREHSEDLLAIAAVTDYFKELYWQKGDGALDREGLMSLLATRGPDNLPFETVSAKFRMIDSVMRPVIAPFEVSSDGLVMESPVAAHALKALSDFDKTVRVGELARTLQPYLVQLPEQAYQRLRQVGAIQPVGEALYGEQFMRLTMTAHYDSRFGVHWDDPALIKADEMCW